RISACASATSHSINEHVQEKQNCCNFWICNAATGEKCGLCIAAPTLLHYIGTCFAVQRDKNTISESCCKIPVLATWHMRSKTDRLGLPDFSFPWTRNSRGDMG